MPAKVYRPEFDQSEFDSANIGGDYYREVAERILIPRIKERNKQILNVAPDWFQFYQRAYTGRRCSCISGIETSPSSTCLVCYGTGNTDSYQLYGHRTEVFDVTSTSSGVNIEVDYNKITRPLSFCLSPGALRGYVDFQLNVMGGLPKCSLVSMHATAGRGTSLRAGVKLFSEQDFVPLNKVSLEARLAEGQKQGGIPIRVLMTRDSASLQSPRFSHLRVRYQTLDDDKIPGDRPNGPESNRSSEFGNFEDIATRSLFIDSRLRSVTSEDLFRQVNTGRLWKCFSTNPLEVAGQLLSWDIELVIVQQSSRFASLP